MNKNIYSCVRAYNLVNAAYVMILATVVDEFEQRVYALDDETIAAMTSEDFDAIMTEVCEPYGGVDWVSSNISDPHNYWRQVAISNPVYYISYAVSAVAAVEIFALAEEDTEAAFTAYRALVENVTEEDGFLNALKKAGLYTPFEEEAFKQISTTMKKKVN
jgi:oligoendopeptidase F